MSVRTHPALTHVHTLDSMHDDDDDDVTIICVWSVVTHTDAQGQKCVWLESSLVVHGYAAKCSR